MSKPTYGRRNLMKAAGLGAGAYLVHPMLRQLVSQAAGQPSGTPRRFLVFLNSLGTRSEHIPVMNGGTLDLKSFSALAPIQSDVTVVKNFFCPFDLHLHGNKWVLSGMASQGVKTSFLPDRRSTAISRDRSARVRHSRR